MFFAIEVMTQAIIELEFSESFRKRRIKRMIERLSGHLILCGCGSLGRGEDAVQGTGVPLVIVDRSEDKAKLAIRSGMPAVLADATRDEALRKLGIARARGLVDALATDAVFLPNLVTGVRLTRATLRPHVFEFIWEARRIASTIMPRSPRTCSSASERPARRGAMTPAESAIAAGDHFIVTGDGERQRAAERMLAGVAS